MKPTVVISLAAVLVSLSGCRGQISTEAPVHLNPNMDSQPRYDNLGESAFFADGRVARLPPDGTVAVGYLRGDDALSRGLDENGDFVSFIPIEVDEALLDRGAERYTIYCMPCHDPTGAGNGRVIQKAAQGGTRWIVPSYHDARIREMPDGEVYNAIYNGVRTMPSYRHQVRHDEDRWAIVAYIRALQRARVASLYDSTVND